MKAAINKTKLCRMSIALLILPGLFFCNHVLGQGSWNMQYIPIDSLDESFVGKELRIDFKPKEMGEANYPNRNIRMILSRRDTVTLNLANQAVRFAENWKIHVDHGVLSDQTLQTINGRNREQLIIREMFVLAVSHSIITVQVYIYPLGSNERARIQEINIDKSLIAGVIIAH
jgi:hypothetical protein